MKRGEIYWINLDPTIGSEIQKTRPGLILSNDINNVHAETVTILPLTSSVKHVHPFEVLVKPDSFDNDKPVKIKADQIRTVDKRRIGRLLGNLPQDLIPHVERAVKLHLAL
ncbi:MAG: type II toxin-antitoxin system PemK/MazF family toxin [Elusimicrobia bacterium]|nr:type II toxin-antitoxin system PemK/MazF family toxin [Elusimicrobiota bacterium]